MTWIFKTFDSLTPHELYAIIQLRNEVFVVEQNCVFQDADNKDPHCHHLMGWEQEQLMAYARIVPSGISYAEPSIGRIVTSPAARGRNFGRDLVRRSIEALYNLYGTTPIRIGAQYRLTKFYREFGFRENGAVYLEDGIEHIEMLLPRIIT